MNDLLAKPTYDTFMTTILWILVGISLFALIIGVIQLLNKLPN